MENADAMRRTLAFLLEIATEEWIFDFPEVKVRRTAAEIHISKTLEVGTFPSAVPPRAEGEIEVRRGRLLANRLVEVPCAVTILGVEQTADNQDGGLQIIARTAGVARLPELIEVRMGLNHVPKGRRRVVHQRIGVFEGAEGEEVGIYVVFHNLAHDTLLLMATFECRQEIRGLQESEGTVVVSVVAPEPVGNRTLGRDGLQRGMAARCGHRGVESVVADAPGADVAIIIGIMEQPVDRVVGIRRLVDTLTRFRLGIERADLDELAFALVAAADVLIDEDVVVLDIQVAC